MDIARKTLPVGLRIRKFQCGQRFRSHGLRCGRFWMKPSRTSQKFKVTAAQTRSGCEPWCSCYGIADFESETRSVGRSLDRFATGKLRLYTQKTGTHVHCPLPHFVDDELEAIPKASPRFWFWSRNGKLQTAIAVWQGRLIELFDDAKVEGGRAHRFRDTFATELLLASVPLDRVSILLGHQSVKITERHYAPWIRERQEQV